MAILMRGRVFKLGTTENKSTKQPKLFSELRFQRARARADYSATQPPVVATSFPGSLSYQSRSLGTGMREPWERGCCCRRGCCHCRCCPFFPCTHLPSIIPSLARGSDRFGFSPMRVSLSFATSSSIIFMSGYSLSTS